MFDYKKLLLAVLLAVIVSVPMVALADSFSIPSYAPGQNLDASTASIGQRIATWMLRLAGIAVLLGGLYSAILMGMSKADEGKRALGWVLIGAAVAGSIGGILKLVLPS